MSAAPVPAGEDQIAAMPPARPSAVRAAPAPDGWHPDPFGLHEERWLSDGIATSLVRDHGVETDHEPPAA